MSISIPITLSGKDAAGHPFKENSRTVIINKHGAKVATAHQLALGAEIVVENRALGRTAKGNVVWLGDKVSSKELVEVGLQLNEAQNIWGIEFPPEDWQEGPPIGPGGQRLDTSALPAHKSLESTASKTSPQASAPQTPPKTPVKPVQPMPPPAPAPVASAPSAVKSAPAPAVKAPAAPSPSKTLVATRPPIAAISESVPPASDAVLARFSRMMQETAEADLRSFTEKLAKLGNQFGAQAQTTLQEAANRLEEVVGSHEKRLNELGGKLEATRAETETLLAKFQGLKDSSKEVERVQRGIQDAGSQALQAALKDLQTKARSALDDASAGFVNQTRKRVQEEAAAAMEAVSKRASERLSAMAGDLLSKASPDFQARQKQLLEQFRAQLGEMIQAATAEFRGRINKMAAEVAPSLRAEIDKSVKVYASQGMERSIQQAFQKLPEKIQQDVVKAVEQNFKVEAETCRKKLGEVTASALAGFERKAQALQEDMHGRLQKTFLKFQEKGARDLSDKLQKSVDDLLDSLAKQLDKHGGDTLELLNEELKTTGKKLLDDALKQLRTATQASLDSLALEAKTSSEQHRRSLREAFLESRDRSAEELMGHLQQALAKQRDTLLKQVQAGADGSIAQAVAQIKEKVEQVTREASDTVNKQVGAAAVVLKDWEDEARERLQSHSQKIEANARASVEAFQKKLDDNSPAALGKLRKEMDGLVREFRDNMQEAARTLQEKSAEAIRRKLEAVTEESVESSTSQLRKRADENLDLVTERLKSNQREAAVEAENLFRETIANMLKMVVQPAPSKASDDEPTENTQRKTRR